MKSKVVRLCDTCGFPLTKGKVPIIWPGTAKTATYCSLRCAEAGGVRMHPIQREAQLAGELA